mgnify:CR=1 FL=1
MMRTMLQPVCCLISGLIALTLESAVYAQSAPPVRIYLDAAWTGATTSSDAIEQGIRTALDEVGNQLAGRPVELVVKDHHGNTRRSKSNLNEYLADEQALVVFAGLHSPPLVANRNFINEQGILVLDPWAAAGPITRYPSPTNSIFRLSVDDLRAGPFLVAHTVKAHGSLKPALLLEETAWGLSSEKSMSTALSAQGLEPSTVKWFNWNLKPAGARILLREIVESKADAIILVANATEGKVIAEAMADLPSDVRLPIISHWGITGGDFAQTIGPALRAEIDLCFIQTRFSFISDLDDTFGNAVFERAKKLFPDTIRSREDIHAPVGFIHAYDLTRILIAAVEQCGLSGEIRNDRVSVRDALENLQSPVQGLIKRYERPFCPYSEAMPDAHEALTVSDYAMAYYGTNNEIRLIRRAEQ